jgi:serine/threonine protein kinase
MAREARALARVTHPNVVQITDVFDEGSSLVLVLELVRGGALDQKMVGKAWEVSRAVDVMKSVLLGLHAIHEAGLVHRDIKPANILMDVDGVTPKVTDLGIAHDGQDTSMTLVGARLGTPEYMSPEQFKGGSVDQRSDIYSCGIVLYELLVGHVPFKGGSEYDVAKGHVELEPDWNAIEAPPHVMHALRTAMSKKPEDRWGSCAEFGSCLQGETQVPSPAPQVASTVKSSAPAYEENLVQGLLRSATTPTFDADDLDSFARDMKRKRWIRTLFFLFVGIAGIGWGVHYMTSPKMEMRGVWEREKGVMKKIDPITVTITGDTLWIDHTKTDQVDKYTYEVLKEEDDKAYLEITGEDDEDEEIVIELRNKKLIIWDEDEDVKRLKLKRAR